MSPLRKPPVTKPAAPAPAPTPAEAPRAIVRVMGVDPGLATAGFGVVEWTRAGRTSRVVASGETTTPATMPLAERLGALAAWLRAAIAEHRPDEVAIEETFYALNVKTTVQMAHGRGALIAAAAEAGLPVAEYSALSIKQAVTGYGRAGKEQIARMVGRELKLAEVPTSTHASDALAVALCHVASLRHPTVAGLSKLRADVAGRGSQRRGKAAWRQFKPKPKAAAKAPNPKPKLPPGKE